MQQDQEALRANIKKIYLFNILKSTIFVVPVMVMFLKDNGLSLMDALLLQSYFSLVMVVLEIPSGYIADSYGRKETLVFASVMALCGILGYVVSYDFWDFLVSMTFMAISYSFTSGTLSALVYDTLNGLDEVHRYQKIWGESLFYGLIALAVASIVGAWIAQFDLRYPIYATIPFFAMMIPLSLSFYEPKREKAIFKDGYANELITIAKKTFIQSAKLRWIIIYSAVIFAFNQSMFYLYQPYFELSGIDIAYFGVVFALFQLVAGVVSKYAHQIERRLGERQSMISLTVALSISYLLMSNFIYLFSFIFAFLQQFVRGFRNVIVADYINKLVDSTHRATILSIESFVGKLLYAIILPIWGWVADIYSLETALSVIGVTALLSGGSVLLILRKKGVL